MSDDEPLSPIAPAEAADDARYAETLLYDFGKFLTSLSLLVLGGIVSFAPTMGLDTPANRPMLTLMLGGAAVAGISALSVVSAIITARARHRAPPRYLLLLARIATGALGIGVGAFITAWIET